MIGSKFLLIVFCIVGLIGNYRITKRGHDTNLAETHMNAENTLGDDLEGNDTEDAEDIENIHLTGSGFN